jgi:hypothetical protein
LTGRTNTTEACPHVHQQEIVIVTEKETGRETETKKRTGNGREKENVIKRRNVKERERRRKSERRKGKEKKKEKRKRRKNESVRRSVKEKKIVIVGEVDLQKLKGKIAYLVLHEENRGRSKTRGKKILQTRAIPRTKVTGKKVISVPYPIVANCAQHGNCKCSLDFHILRLKY